LPAAMFELLQEAIQHRSSVGDRRDRWNGRLDENNRCST
jgi:hypothetical protein